MEIIEIKKDSSVSRLMDELQVDSGLTIVAVNGKVLSENERECKELKRGDRVTLLTIFVDG